MIVEVFLLIISQTVCDSAGDRISSVQKSVESSTDNTIQQVETVSLTLTSNSSHLTRYTDELKSSLSSKTQELSHLFNHQLSKDKPSGNLSTVFSKTVLRQCFLTLFHHRFPKTCSS